MSSPKTLDEKLNTFVGAETETKVLPLGKISTGRNLIYVFYLTFEYDKSSENISGGIAVQAFSIKGDKQGTAESFLSFTSTNLDDIIVGMNKFRIIHDAKNKMKFLVKESFFDKRTEVEYAPEKKTCIVDKL